MTPAVTLVLLLTCVGLTAFCGWMGAQPRDYAKPRLIPWQLLMLVGAALVLVAIVGLLNELGITTGANR